MNSTIHENDSLILSAIIISEIGVDLIDSIVHSNKVDVLFIMEYLRGIIIRLSSIHTVNLAVLKMLNL